eukprot:SAG25_NODE_1204_length_3621_cov_8.932993_3_plen_198_part_00
MDSRRLHLAGLLQPAAPHEGGQPRDAVALEARRQQQRRGGVLPHARTHESQPQARVRSNDRAGRTRQAGRGCRQSLAAQGLSVTRNHVRTCSATEFSGPDLKIVGKSQPVQNSGPDTYVVEVVRTTAVQLTVSSQPRVAEASCTMEGLSVTDSAVAQLPHLLAACDWVLTEIPLWHACSCHATSMWWCGWRCLEPVL